MTPGPPAPPRSRSVIVRLAGALTLGWSNHEASRRAIRSFVGRRMRLALLRRSRPLLPASLGSILVVSPHPDDEAIGCGGTLATLAAGGARPQVVFLTDGSASHPDHPTVSPGALAAIRRAEAGHAAEALGLEATSLAFLNGPDGRLAVLTERESQALVDQLAAMLARFGPQVVMLPCRDDRSSEHEAAFRLTQRALESSRLRPRVLEFPIWAWRNPWNLLQPWLRSRIVWRVDLAEAAAAKAAALAAYASQTLPFPPATEAVLSAEFLRQFQQAQEFFFER